MNHHYIRLAVMAVLSFLSMYALMYVMVDRLPNVYPNLNQFYMAGLMTAPMVLIEFALMGAMYRSLKANTVIAVLSVAAALVFFICIRQQAAVAVAVAVAVADEQLLRSMIPHHAGAILMCEEAPVQDAEIKELCETIMSGQQSSTDEGNPRPARSQVRTPECNGDRTPAAHSSLLVSEGVHLSRGSRVYSSVEPNQEEPMIKIPLIASAAAICLLSPAFAATDNLCNDAHMKQMDSMIAEMKDETKKKEATEHLDMSKAEMKKGNNAGCMEHMNAAHKAMGM